MTGWWLLVVYLLSFGPAVVFSQLYAAREPGRSRLKAALYGHAYVFYCLMWYVAGWKATWRALIGETGWAKTDRQVETPDSILAPELDADVAPTTVARSTVSRRGA